LQLSVRNLGWSGDTITLQPRPLNFGDAARHLTEQKADVIIAFFGLNESFDGEAGLAAFERDLDKYLATLKAAQYNGRSGPRIALVSPIAHEKLTHLRHVDVDARNRELARYTEAMKRTAAEQGVVFVDLYTPTRAAMERAETPLTINGIHVNGHGDRIVGGLLMAGLGFGPDATREASTAETRALDELREDVRDKNQQFFYRFRPLNAEYVVGRRVDPFGSVNFPGEMRELDRMVSDRDKKIWKRAKVLEGLRYPAALRPASSAAERRN
jgi:lysophospholipase L1-like esterase